MGGSWEAGEGRIGVSAWAAPRSEGPGDSRRVWPCVPRRASISGVLMFSAEGESKESGDKGTPSAPPVPPEMGESRQPGEGARPRLQPPTSDLLPGEGVGHGGAQGRLAAPLSFACGRAVASFAPATTC